MKQPWFFLILLTLALTPVEAMETPPEKQADLVMAINVGATLRLDSRQTQWLVIQQQLTAISLREGNLLFFQPDGQGEWSELYRLNPLEQPITAFLVKDLDGDRIAEIIVGTAEPGFIYIYKYFNGQWQPRNYGKYVWSNVTAITAGAFDGPADLAILVQNQEGFLYLLKPSPDSLDLVWCSPSPWRPIERFLTIDIDHDAAAEIVALYRNSGLVILKTSHNSVISIWENFPWGKLLAVTATDWDQDQLPELTFSTSQKILYHLIWDSTNLELQEKLDHFGYTIEHLTGLAGQSSGQLLAIDTNGKTHLLKFNPADQQWQEEWAITTGRITQIIDSSNLKNLFFWRSDQRLTNLTVYPAAEIKLRGWGRDYPLPPGDIVYHEKRLYLSPTVLTAVPELKLAYTSTPFVLKISNQQTTVELDPADPGSFVIKGEQVIDPEPPLLINNKLLLSLGSYQRLFRIELIFDLTGQTLTITPPPLVQPQTKTAAPDQPEEAEP